MFNSMEDKGQYYHQCVKEIREHKMISLGLQYSVGPVAILSLDDSPLSKVMSRTGNTSFVLEGTSQITLLILN